MTGVELFIYAILLILCGMFLWEIVFANKGYRCMDHPPAPSPPPLLKSDSYGFIISNDHRTMSDYRIKQIKDDGFIVEKRTSDCIVGAFWSQCGKHPYDPLPIVHSSLDDARKWIADIRKYPIYHEAEPDSIGRDYENLETK